MLYNLLQSADKWLDEIGLFSLVRVLYQLEFRAFFAVVFSFVLVLLYGRRTIRWRSATRRFCCRRGARAGN